MTEQILMTSLNGKKMKKMIPKMTQKRLREFLMSGVARREVSR